MDARSLQVLELDLVRARLAGLTSFSGGRERALGLEPSGDPEEVGRRARLTEEAIAARQDGVGGPGGAVDVRDAARQAARGATLSVGRLEEVLATAEQAAATHAELVARAGLAPGLAALGERIDAPALAATTERLAQALDTRGGLRDDASAELAGARRMLSRARREAEELLRRLGSELRAHLQERFITERSGRPVLAVRASARGAVPGLVHDRSASGQTLFVEPMALVEANNRTRELELAEAAEQERILVELSGDVGAVAPALAEAVEALADVDLALACAALSTAWRGCPVEIADGVTLEGVRHPLIDPTAVVPIDLDLRGLSALVVSGPNTGGKTVALKTLGLAALCHQCGLRVPARAARLPVFGQVLADIGDEQSIARSLSTFSGHVRALMGILAAAGAGSLVLLDEIAAGTDPLEGAALAQALLERLVERGALTLVTTHHGALKEWAATTTAASNAAVEIDPRTLTPRYRLVPGQPGASYALEIAERLGLEEGVVTAARALLRLGGRGAEALLTEAARARAEADDLHVSARAELERAAAERREAQERASALARERERIRADLESERERARTRARQELHELSSELEMLRREIAGARREERRRAAAPGSEESGRESARDRHLGEASASARRARAAFERTAPAPAAAGRPARVGDEVHDPVLGVRGRVVAIEGVEATVQGPAARLRLPLSRLEVRAETPPPQPAPIAPAPRAAESEAASAEIDLRGRRAVDARAAVRSGIDDAALAGLSRVRVIHGHGTGALRAAVREELARHPLVERADAAPPEEGGDGATLVYL